MPLRHGVLPYGALMQHDRGNITEHGGWVTTRQAARALNVMPRQVRNYIAAGDLEGRKEGNGVTERWLVSISSVEALRQKRHSEDKLPRQYRDVSGDAEDTGQSVGNTAELIRELAARLEDAQYELGRAESRLELTSQAESTLREDLARERKRAEAERERADRLEAELREAQKQPTELREAPETVSEDTEKVDAPPEQQEPTEHRSWWRRFFGIE
jgi:methyl-accepting chemotaxis protein